MTIDQYAITSLAYVKMHMGITGVDSDALLEFLINSATAKIELITDRHFASREYREWHNWQGGPLNLRNPPITALKRIAHGQATAMSIRATTTTDIRATVELQDNQLVLSRFASTGVETATTLTYALYPTSALMAAQINLTSGWTATATNMRCLMLDVHRLGGGDALTGVVDVTFPDCSASYTTRVDEVSGVVEISPYWSGYDDSEGYWGGSRLNMLVQYMGGYTAVTMPYDIVEICMDFVQDAYNARGHDQNMKSESLGDYSYTLMSGVEVSTDQWEKLRGHRRLTA